MIYMYVENTDNKIKHLLNKHYIVPNYISNNFKMFMQQVKSIDEPTEEYVLYMILFGYCYISVAEFKYFLEKELYEHLTKKGIKYKVILSTTSQEYLVNRKRSLKAEQEVYYNVFTYDPLVEIDKRCFEILRSGEYVEGGLKAEIVGNPENITAISEEFILSNNLSYVKTELDYDAEEDCFKLRFRKEKGVVLRNDPDYPNDYFVEGALDFLAGNNTVDSKENKESNAELIDSITSKISNQPDDTPTLEEVHKYKPVINQIDKFDPSSITEDLEDLGDLIQKIHVKDNKITKRQRAELKRNEAIREKAEKDRVTSVPRNSEKDKQIQALKESGYSDTVLEILSKVDSEKQ